MALSHHEGPTTGRDRAFGPESMALSHHEDAPATGARPALPAKRGSDLRPTRRGGTIDVPPTGHEEPAGVRSPVLQRT